MLPAPFEYSAPETMDEALDLLDALGDESKVLAGGQSLIPLLKLRFARPAHLVDVNRVAELDFLDEHDGVLRIGPLFRHKAAERSGMLASKYAVIAEAARQVADPIVRNRGTVGGSLAHADPAGDWGSVMLALDAEFVLRSKRGSRTIRARDFFSGPFSSALKSKVSLSRALRKMDDGKVKSAGIGLTAVGPQNLKADRAEAALKGRALDDATIKEAAALAAAAAEPKADNRGSVDYKRNVVRVFTERGLRRARERAQGGA